jgi:predicted transposase/invertase (TIGR01784 family)
MQNLEHIKGADQLPKFLTEDWIEQAMEKLDKSKMTAEQRMQYEMMMAKNASIIEMLKEEERQRIATETAKQTARLMKKAGEPIEKIIQYTDLTIEEIENL